MNKTFLHFAKRLTIFALILTLLSIAVDKWLPEVPMTPVYLYLIAFIYAVNFLLLGKLSRDIQDKPNRFINTYMLLNFGKLFLFIIVIGVYAYLHRSDAVTFAVTFMIYYIFFAFFEITALLKMNKKDAV
jgi:hypothetical protein